MENINLEFFYNLEKQGKESVIDFCIKMRFFAGSYECPECKKPMKLIYKTERNRDGCEWRCLHRNAVKRTVRSGSWFQGSNLSLIQMLKLVYLWVKRTNYNWIADELKMSPKTVCDWMAFCRRVCESAVKKEGIFMGGPDMIVEIDAKSFSVKKGQDTWVFGGVERDTKKCFLETIHSGEEDEILSILRKYVLPGTTIISDNWKGFDCLESNGYVHQKVCKSFGFKDPITGAHKNNILCLWARLKKVVNQRIMNDQFDGYLAEIMWRRLHKENTQGVLMLFFKILGQIFPPRVRDDATYISRKTQIENKRREDCVKSASDMELSKNQLIAETPSQEVNTDNYEGEMTSSSNSSSSSSLEDEENRKVQEKETHLNEMNGNDNEKQGESVCGLQILENQFFEEIEVEVPLVYSEDLLSEDEFEGENGSQKKRQKTMESLDT